jgi:hypothetical protein
VKVTYFKVTEHSVVNHTVAGLTMNFAVPYMPRLGLTDMNPVSV